jgi:glycosyltransferase involved in cell wall biosynthesis
MNAQTAATVSSEAQAATPTARLRIVIGLEGLALGGCTINALDLARTLRGRGHDVSVFAIDEDAKVSLLPYSRAAGFEVDVVPARTGIAPLSREIARRARGADIVHVFAPWMAPAARVAAITSPGQAVVSTNWTMSNVSYVPQDVPQILGTVGLQREARASHRSPVWLVEPPVDLAKDAPDPALGRSFRRQWGIADAEVAAVLVSRVDAVMKAESMRYAIRACRLLEDPAWRLVIVGDGDAFDDIAAEATRTNDAMGRPAVVLTGALQDPRPAYAGADVTLGMGGSALRCLAHAKPLVVLGVNGFARTFGPDTAAEFYESGFFGAEPVAAPVDHLASCLTELIEPATRHRLGPFGRAEVAGRFDLEVASSRVEAVYMRALADRPGPVRRRAVGWALAARHLAHQAKVGLSQRAQRALPDAVGADRGSSRSQDRPARRGGGG